LTSAWVNKIVPSSGCLLLRMAMCPSGKAATSTQVPLLPLKLLVRYGLMSLERSLVSPTVSRESRGAETPLLHSIKGWRRWVF
jgi:hypothetical protein